MIDWRGGTPNRWDNHFSPSKPQSGITFASRRPHHDVGNQWFRCKADLSWSRQLSRLVTDVRVLTNGVLTIRFRKSRTDTVRIQWSVNDISGICRTTCPSWASGPQCAVINHRRLVPFQRHHGTHMVAWHEGHPLHISPNSELLDWGWTS